MKKTGLLAVCICVLSMSVISCNGGSNTKTEDNQNQEMTDSLTDALAAQDSLMSLLTEINDGMTQIKDMESIISSTNLQGESTSQKDKIKENMVLISKALTDRRERLDALEKKLKNSNSYSAKMQKTVESLKAQITSQETTIADLQESLKKANIEIEGLNVKVADLSSTVQNVTNEKVAAQEEATNIANKLNTCYYVIGSNKELKANKIIEKKFLGKTKVMEGDFETSYFTKSDKRTLSTLPLHSKSAKILSKHPQGSYQIEDNAGVKSLKITNPTKFWELSNFLVVEIK